MRREAQRRARELQRELRRTDRALAVLPERGDALPAAMAAAATDATTLRQPSAEHAEPIDERTRLEER